MKPSSRLLFCLLLLVCPLFISHSATMQSSIDSNNRLVIGTKIAPPFAMKNAVGEWEGLSIKLWTDIAEELNLDFEWKELDLTHLISRVADGSLDAGIAAITVTSKREEILDFGHAYYSTGLSIAVQKKARSGWKNVLKSIFSFRMLQIVSIIFAVLFLIGASAWLIERKTNPEHFHPNPIKGIASGIWWAAVTMTTVGYGDMTPKTLGGRLIALVWMFASLLVVSFIIAGISSTVTLSQMEALVAGPEDLPSVRVASIKSSTSDMYLQTLKAKPTYYPTVKDALDALNRDEVDAVVYDEALLRYLVLTYFSRNLEINDGHFEAQYYGIAFPEGSPLIESTNRQLLKIINKDEWKLQLNKYLGK